MEGYQKLEAIDRRVRHEIARKVYQKYLLLIVRMKISYAALYKRMTVIELFM